jgi:ankyrin repeat protein
MTVGLAVAEEGHAAVTELLITARCNVDLQDKDGYMPLHFAAHNGHTEGDRQGT